MWPKYPIATARKRASQNAVSATLVLNRGARLNPGRCGPSPRKRINAAAATASPDDATSTSATPGRGNLPQSVRKGGAQCEHADEPAKRGCRSLRRPTDDQVHANRINTCETGKRSGCNCGIGQFRFLLPPLLRSCLATTELAPRRLYAPVGRCGCRRLATVLCIGSQIVPVAPCRGCAGAAERIRIRPDH